MDFKLQDNFLIEAEPSLTSNPVNKLLAMAAKISILISSIVLCSYLITLPAMTGKPDPSLYRKNMLSFGRKLLQDSNTCCNLHEDPECDPDFACELGDDSGCGGPECDRSGDDCDPDLACPPGAIPDCDPSVDLDCAPMTNESVTAEL